MATLMFTAERDSGHPFAIDRAIQGKDGILRGAFSGETLAEMRDRYPGAQVETLASIATRADDSFRTDPMPCTAEDFEEMLGVLPPEGWTRVGGSESFKMSEYTCGSITAIYARIGEEFWTFEDSFTLSHAEIVEKIAAAQGSGIRNLACATCGSGSGPNRQFHNRDTGYGTCTRCADWIEDRDGAEFLAENYGIRGYHFDLPEEAK